jgi:hypothetical protein
MVIAVKSLHAKGKVRQEGWPGLSPFWEGAVLRQVGARRAPRCSMPSRRFADSAPATQSAFPFARSDLAISRALRRLPYELLTLSLENASRP